MHALPYIVFNKTRILPPDSLKHITHEGQMALVTRGFKKFPYGLHYNYLSFSTCIPKNKKHNNEDIWRQERYYYLPSRLYHHHSSTRNGRVGQD